MFASLFLSVVPALAQCEQLVNVPVMLPVSVVVDCVPKNVNVGAVVSTLPFVVKNNVAVVPVVSVSKVDAFVPAVGSTLGVEVVAVQKDVVKVNSRQVAVRA